MRLTTSKLLRLIEIGGVDFLDHLEKTAHMYEAENNTFMAIKIRTHITWYKVMSNSSTNDRVMRIHILKLIFTLNN